MASLALVLAALTLSSAHCENLLGRGLSNSEIDVRRYRFLPAGGRAKIAGNLREQFGDAILNVPGFVTKRGNRGNYVTLAGAAGLLIP